MKFGILHQDKYSRGELLLRAFFGIFYIQLPHAFVLLFLSIGSGIIRSLSFWIVLFTGNLPKGLFDYQVKVFRWSIRLNARLSNLADGYPAFGLNAVDDKVVVEVEYPENLSRGKAVLRLLFGPFMLLPHVFCLLFLAIGVMVVRLLSFWIILITAKFPKGMHDYLVGVMRWGFRINAWWYYLTDKYPPFSLKGDEADFSGVSKGDDALLDQ